MQNNCHGWRHFRYRKYSAIWCKQHTPLIICYRVLVPVPMRICKVKYHNNHFLVTQPSSKHTTIILFGHHAHARVYIAQLCRPFSVGHARSLVRQQLTVYLDTPAQGNHSPLLPRLFFECTKHHDCERVCVQNQLDCVCVGFAVWKTFARELAYWTGRPDKFVLFSCQNELFLTQKTPISKHNKRPKPTHVSLVQRAQSVTQHNAPNLYVFIHIIHIQKTCAQKAKCDLAMETPQTAGILFQNIHTYYSYQHVGGL